MASRPREKAPQALVGGAGVAQVELHALLVDDASDVEPTAHERAFGSVPWGLTDLPQGSSDGSP